MNPIKKVHANTCLAVQALAKNKIMRWVASTKRQAMSVQR